MSLKKVLIFEVFVNGYKKITFSTLSKIRVNDRYFYGSNEVNMKFLNIFLF